MRFRIKKLKFYTSKDDFLNEMSSGKIDTRDVGFDTSCLSCDYKYPILVQYIGSSECEDDYEKLIVWDQDNKKELLKFLGI